MKILICDDHKIVREGLKQILCQMEGNNTIEEASDGNQALAVLKENPFDVLLLDISLPDRNGLEILRLVKEKWPATNVLILSMHSQETFAMRSFALGALGYLTKDTAIDELIEAVKKVSQGKKYISSSLQEVLFQHLEKDKHIPKHQTLSNREFDIMIRIANGKSLLEIGRELSISNKTVSTYRTRILEKLELSRNIEITWYCMEQKLI